MPPNKKFVEPPSNQKTLSHQFGLAPDLRTQTLSASFGHTDLIIMPAAPDNGVAQIDMNVDVGGDIVQAREYFRVWGSS